LTEQPRAGNDIININLILKHLKKDDFIQNKEEIADLTAFTLL
jgi:hypothetical protein